MFLTMKDQMDFLNLRASWLARANKFKPVLKHWSVPAVSIVECVPSDTAWQQTEVKTIGSAAALSTRRFKTGDSFVVAFAESVVGRIHMKLSPCGKNDSPLRIRLIAAEMPYEIARGFNDYHGTLSSSWLQEEFVNIDVLPCACQFPRRYSLRYLKIEIIAAAGEVVFDELKVVAESAEERMPDSPSGLSEVGWKIDRVALRTLRNCMQDFFEDGPKRDRRLWLGDLRLQAKANMQSFGRHDLAERSLLLLAAATDDQGRVPACIYTEPELRHGNDLIDYALLFSDVVNDYVAATSNVALGKELFPLVCRQFELFRPNINANGLVREDIANSFIDWAQFNRQAAMQGVYIYALKAGAQLALRLGNRNASESLNEEAGTLSRALKKLLYKPSQKVVVSGPNNEISYASQIWAILAGVFSKDDARSILSSIEGVAGAIAPKTPYLFHHLVEAYFYADMKSKANALIEYYWGGMIKNGADTFWEVFDPNSAFLSPYGDALINSACHAWSCTPICFHRSR